MLPLKNLGVASSKHVGGEAGGGRSLRFRASFGEAAWNKIRRDSSEMNPGWSLAPANQITTQRQRSMCWCLVFLPAESYGLETPRAERRDAASARQMRLIGDERAPEFPPEGRASNCFC